jgi:tRNA(Ile)-lysidine synthase
MTAREQDSSTSTARAATRVPEALRAVLRSEAPRPGECWLVAFSGGPDSAALATGLAEVAPEAGLAIVLAHVDHRIDSGSGERARRAARLAERIGLPFRCLEVDVPAQRMPRESPEAGARRLRYAALEALRVELGATRVVTAHQRDDQVETVLLRLLRRAPVEALGGIEARREGLLRPLLEIERTEIGRFLGQRELESIEDPTNSDLRIPRNRLRRAVLPGLEATEPGLSEALLDLARRSASTGRHLERIFRRAFGLPAEKPPGGEPPPVVAHDRLLALPPTLRLPALRCLIRNHYSDRLPSRASLEQFLEQIERRPATARLPLPLGRAGAQSLVVLAGAVQLEPAESRIPSFSYTFSTPGEVELPELGLKLRIRRSPVEPWMFRGHPRRVGFSAGSGSATVRCRRPGDRMRPLGSPGTRKVKDLLIDRRVPAAKRDRLPVLEIGGRIVWVAGVALDERFRLAGDGDCWLAELEPLEAASSRGEVERNGQ